MYQSVFQTEHCIPAQNFGHTRDRLLILCMHITTVRVILDNVTMNMEKVIEIMKVANSNITPATIYILLILHDIS